MPKFKSILGFDPSLTSSGYAFVRSGDVVAGRIIPKKLKDQARLCYVRDALSELLQEGFDCVSYEDYSMGSRGKTFHIGELGGVLKTYVFEQSVDVLLVPPTTLKVAIAGHGGADKAMMIEALQHRYGYRTEHDDEADAFALYQLGLAYFHTAKARTLPKKQRDALPKCTLIRGQKG